jgi:hypothetical protein
MGYQSSATTTTLTAKLTPLGRQLLMSNTNTLISKFSLGDSDANYRTIDLLASGSIPSMGGDLDIELNSNNSVGNDAAIKYPIGIDSLGSTLKDVQPESINVTNTLKNLGQVSGITGTSIVMVDRTYTATDPLVNLFSSFGLPITYNQKLRFSTTSYSNGGWADTALSGFGADKIVVVNVPNSTYGENLDGKEIKVDLTTTASTYSIYSTFQNKSNKLTTEDVNYKDTANNTAEFGTSLGFLVSDDIMKPNGGDVTLSWSTGFGLNKPFSVNNKKRYNLLTNTNVSLTGDTVIGLAYLNKGLLVITEPTIVDEFTETGTTANITINSVATDVVQNITCIASRGEFISSRNPTFNVGDVVRISEIGLYDDSNRLIAYGKFDRQVLKTPESFISFGIKITL